MTLKESYDGYFAQSDLMRIKRNLDELVAKHNIQKNDMLLRKIYREIDDMLSDLGRL